MERAMTVIIFVFYPPLTANCADSSYLEALENYFSRTVLVMASLCYLIVPANGFLPTKQPKDRAGADNAGLNRAARKIVRPFLASG
jgi:hypothetical protein